jgi:translation elongation factor EF-1alpha
VFVFKARIGKGETLNLLCCTQKARVRVSEICERIDTSSYAVSTQDARVLTHLDAGIVIMDLLTPVYLAEYARSAHVGRFVLVKNGELIAGGTIIECLAHTAGLRHLIAA